MSFIGSAANNILHKLPLLDAIIFESNPDYSCNTYPVFVEMRKRLPNYKMIWMTSKETPKQTGVYDVFYYDDKSLINKMKSKYYRSRAKALISCNRFGKMGCQREGQVSLFLGHGSKTKKTRRENFSYCPGLVVDYVNIQSHFFDDVTSFEYNADKDQLVYLGYPRCDWFYANNDINTNLSKIGINVLGGNTLPSLIHLTNDSAPIILLLIISNLGCKKIVNSLFFNASENCKEYCCSTAKRSVILSSYILYNVVNEPLTSFAATVA